jgi:hypothetical protein
MSRGTWPEAQSLAAQTKRCGGQLGRIGGPLQPPGASLFPGGTRYRDKPFCSGLQSIYFILFYLFYFILSSTQSDCPCVLQVSTMAQASRHFLVLFSHWLAVTLSLWLESCTQFLLPPSSPSVPLIQSLVSKGPLAHACPTGFRPLNPDG